MMTKDITPGSKVWKVMAMVLGLILAVILLVGLYDGDQKLVETTYIVKEGDSLWDISERFLQMNTGGRRYILEFQEGIKELNPELQKDPLVYPGQQIRINYWVKVDEYDVE